MAEPKPGMGRGLERDPVGVARRRDRREEELREMPVELISPNPKQPRRRFDEESLAALAGSLGERGVLQPVLVRPQAGRHLRADRRRAALAGGADRRPARRSRRSCARTRTPQALELALIENMAREDLNPVEEARACAALVEELGLTREDVGRRVGRSRVAVSNLVRLLDLPDEAIELVQQGALSEGHGRALLLAEDHGARRRPGARGGSARAGRCGSPRSARARATPDGQPHGPTRGGGAARRVHPDQEQAATEIAEALGSGARRRGAGQAHA